MSREMSREIYAWRPQLGGRVALRVVSQRPTSHAISYTSRDISYILVHIWRHLVVISPHLRGRYQGPTTCPCTGTAVPVAGEMPLA